jgi:hypothetical protein
MTTAEIIPTKALARRPASTKGRRPRTAPLPGMEDPRFEKIRDLALRFFDLDKQKKSVAKRAEAAKVELLDEMHANKLKRYFDVEAELLVEIEEAAEKLHVTVGKGSEG